MRMAVEVLVMFEKNQSTAAVMTNPGMTSHFGPYLSNRRPVTGDIKPFKIPPGSRMSPDVNAVSISPLCKYIGNRSIVDKDNHHTDKHNHDTENKHRIAEKRADSSSAASLSAA